MHEEENLNGRSVSQSNQFHVSYKVMLILFITAQSQWYRERLQTKWVRKFFKLKG